MTKTKETLLLVATILIVGSLLFGCAKPPPTPASTAPTPTAPPDITPPSAITGFIAVNAYDGRANLWWNRSNAEDFDHYNVYVSESGIMDVTSIAPVHQIKDLSTISYQVRGLETETKYYFAVTAVDKSGNENKQVTSVNAMPTPMPRGTLEPHLYVPVYHSNLAYPGTTLLSIQYDPQKPRIIEVNMLGEIIWEYSVPVNLRRDDKPGIGVNPGFDVELLPNNNILFVSPGKGIYEIDREGNIVWSYLTKKISHDADRLPDGNTLVVFGDHDQTNDAQVKEINPEGEIVWDWYAKDHFYKPPYEDIYNEGWTHTNAVSRLPNGNTLISPRNFCRLIEVDAEGETIRTIGDGVIFSDQNIRFKAYEYADPFSPHDPEVLPNGNILMASQYIPNRAVEMVPETGEIVWEFAMPERRTWPVRDANRLINGNTLITGSTVITEVTPQGQIVWELRLKDVTIEPGQGRARGFYKAERISIQK